MLSLNIPTQPYPSCLFPSSHICPSTNQMFHPDRSWFPKDKCFAKSERYEEMCLTKKVRKNCIFEHKFINFPPFFRCIISFYGTFDTILCAKVSNQKNLPAQSKLILESPDHNSKFLILL